MADDLPGDGTDEPTDRAGEALGHLQAAARELIAASRAFLDVVEEVVDDPKAGDALLESLGDLTRRFGTRTTPPSDDGVEHIRVD